MTKRSHLPKLISPTLVAHKQVPYVIWGDETSGYVNDLFYALSDQIVAVTITLPPGGHFSASDKFRPYYDTHECLYVLEGQYTCQDAETGEVRTARQGEMIFMPEKRWHFGHNFGDNHLRMLEIIAPPASQAALAHIARPTSVKYFDERALRNLPLETNEGAQNLHVRNERNSVNCLLPGCDPIWCQVLASTGRVSLAVMKLMPRQYSREISFAHDAIYHVEAGEMNLAVEDGGDYFCARAKDVIFIPANVKHRVFNFTDGSARVLLGGAGRFSDVTWREEDSTASS